MGELITEAVTGQLVDDIETAVSAVAGAGALDRRRIADTEVERFKVPAMIDKYVQVCRDVIARRGQRGAQPRSRDEGRTLSR